LGFLTIVSKESTRRPYSRAKLFSSVYGAFLTIPTKDATIDALTSTIETKLLDLRKTDIDTAEIGRIVLSTLKQFDTSAFIRFLAAHTNLPTGIELKKELKKY
jgi:transcriptional repressor NrdR